tara:strand:- start:1 stop:396 length:396 start_codon:yes stop_codon:yes gene_type:complete
MAEKSQYSPDCVNCSLAIRVIQTCHRVLNELGVAKRDVFWVDVIYEASLNDLLFIFNKHSNTVQSLLIIGNNPSLEQLLGYLSKDAPTVNTTGKLLMTAALAILNYGMKSVLSFIHQEQVDVLLYRSYVFI